MRWPYREAESGGESGSGGVAVADAPSGGGESGSAAMTGLPATSGLAGAVPASETPPGIPARQQQRRESPESTGAGLGDLLDWRTLAPEDVRTDKVLQKYESAGEAFKALVNLSHKMGSMVTLPKDDAPQDEWDAYYARMRPKTAEEYQLTDPTMPEGLEIEADFRRMLVQTGFDAGLNSRQMQKFLDLTAQVIQDAHQRQAGYKAELEAEAQDELRRRHGAEAPNLRAKALRSFEQFARGRFGGEYAMRAREKWAQSDLAHDPDMIVVLAQLDEFLNEAKFVDPITGADSSMDQLTMRKGELLSKMHDRNVTVQEREAANRTLLEINQQIARMQEQEAQRASRRPWANSR